MTPLHTTIPQDPEFPANMRTEAYSTRCQPASPLSPQSSISHGLLPAQTRRSRGSQPTSGSRSFQLHLPSYPNMSTPKGVLPTSPTQSPAIVLHRATQPPPMDSPRLMREKQRELIARAQLSSKIAASPMSIKPDAPRLDPLGSPKGPMTPLTLEGQESGDYFSVTGAGRFSPAASPGARSSRSSMSSGGDEKAKKYNQIHLYS